jgi:hypothetical protein
VDWKTKSLIQRNCSRLPILRNEVYSAMQRYAGGLRDGDPAFLLAECARLAGRLREAGVEPEGARFVEVGPGWRLDSAIGFYLAGASYYAAFDLNRYQKPDLVMDSVYKIQADPQTYCRPFRGIVSDRDLDRRINELCAVRDFPQLLKTAHVEYHAPADAAATGLPGASIDVQFSYTVFEHIPGPVLIRILQEASRVLRPGGVALHHIDPSDHFSHTDSSISPINFLQFPEKEWDHLAGNQFGYHNRLRATEFREIYEQAGHEILQWEPSVDPRSLAQLSNGFPLDQRFRDFPADVLCTAVLHVMSRAK